MKERAKKIEDLINNFFGCLDDFIPGPDALKIPEAESEPKIEPRKKDWAKNLVDNAIMMWKETNAIRDFKVDPACRQYLIDVVRQADQIVINESWGFYIQSVLNLVSLRTKNHSEAMLCAFIIGFAYRLLEEETKKAPKKQY